MSESNGSELLGGEGSKKEEKRISLRDKVLGGAPLPPRDLPEDLLECKLASVVHLEEDSGIPRVKFDNSMLDKLALPWKDTLVIKLLSRNLSYPFMKEKLKYLWKLKGGYERRVSFTVDYEFTPDMWVM